MNTLLYLAILSVLGGAAVSAEEKITVYYHEHIGIPTYEAMLKAETLGAPRVAGGFVAAPGQFPYLAGLLTALNIPNVGLRTSVCGGTLLSNTKVLTAAHCWWDGMNQGLNTTVVLGSTLLFSGGVRITTSQVEMHNLFNPANLNHDIAMITIRYTAYQPGLISPVTLPDSFLLWLTFEGNQGIVAGYGVTREWEEITTAAHVRYRQLLIVNNYDCQMVYGLENVIATTICTSGQGLVGPCGGDSGGPLTVTFSGVPTLVGVVSFYAFGGCDIGFPGGYVRVTSYVPWINARL